MSEAKEPVLGNPVPLGLAGFGLTTVLLSLVNAHILPAGGNSIVIPMALVYGGLVQSIAGILAYRAGNTFAMVAFLSYGGFWVWFAALLLLSGNGLIDISKAGPTLGAALLLWGLFTFYMWIGTFRLNIALWLVFLTLWVTYALLGIGEILSSGGLSITGGAIGIICGGLALYISFAEVTNHSFGRDVMPLGPLTGREPSPPLPGVPPK